MTRLRKIVALLLLPSLGVAPPTAPAQGFRPVPRFTAGETVRYRMNLSFTIESFLGPEDDPMANQQTVRRAVDITWRVELVATETDDSTRLRAAIEAFEVEPPEWRQSVRTGDFVGQAVSYRLRPDGRIEDIQLPAAWSEAGNTPAWLGAWLDLSRGSESALPGHPLQPGDHWKSTRARQVPGLPRQLETSESEYLRDEIRGDVRCAAILTRFTTSGGDWRQEIGPGQSRTRTERQLEGEGDRLACYDLQNGRVVDSTQRSHEQLRLRVHDIPRGRAEVPAPLVLETRTQFESHLRMVD